MKVKVLGVREARVGFEEFIYRHRHLAAKALVAIASDTLHLAVKKTPRYSGTAAWNWKMGVDPINSYDIPGTFELNYPQGMLEPVAAGGVESDNLVSNYEPLVSRSIMQIASSRVRTGDPTIYVANSTNHAKKWLEDSDGAMTLREVNQGAYTYFELMDHAHEFAPQILKMEKVKSGYY